MTAPDSMVERVARAWFSVEPLGTNSSDIYAIALTRKISDKKWAAMSSYDKECILRCARAAIEAMREPTPAIVDAGFDFMDAYRADIAAYARECWQAMIDAALS